MEDTQKKEASELEGRVKLFNGELIGILAKYQLGLGAVAFVTPDGRTLARPQVFDDSKKQETAKETPANTENSSEPKEEAKKDQVTSA